MRVCLKTGLAFIALLNAIHVYSGDSCERIALSFQEWTKSGGTGDFEGIPGWMAHECLESMPFRADLALQWLDHYARYLEFHSTLDILKEPPPSYMSPAKDLTLGLEKIGRRILLGGYESQFDFDLDVQNLISRANDGHLSAGLCSQQIFRFENNLPLASVSRDGFELPQLYVYDDLQYLSESQGRHQVSPVTEIEGLDAVYYLEAYFAIKLGFQDPDARYNALFPSPALGFADDYTGGAWTRNVGHWPGAASYTLKFANGTSFDVETSAVWPSRNGPMRYKNGQELFSTSCLTTQEEKVFGTHPRGGPPNHAHLPPGGPEAFPQPFVHHPETGSLQGYFLDSLGLADVAVLQIPHFRVENDVKGLTETVVHFLTELAAKNVTRLVIDLSGNNGGEVVPAFHLFKILFPGGSLYSGTRFRATETIDIMGKIFSKAYDREDLPSDLPLVYANAIEADEHHGFDTWDSLYGPYRFRGYNASALYSILPIDDTLSVAKEAQSSPPYKLDRENIILMTDGHCASTCGLLSALLKEQGVRSVAFGGRPRFGQMQAVGGVKGAQYWSLNTIGRYVRRARELAVGASQRGSPLIEPGLLQRFLDIAPLDTRDFPLRFNAYGGSGINFRNAYAKGDNSTPLQFTYEAADCRLFLTANNYLRPETRWTDAAKAMFFGGDCV